MMKINKLMEGEYLWKLRKIVRARVLVVESTVYRVTLILTPTTCKKVRFNYFDYIDWYIASTQISHFYLR